MTPEGSQQSSPQSDGSCIDPGLFDGMTAWFSSSVQPQLKAKWVENHGKLADVDSAMYVFSSNASADDTYEIYVTDAYLTEHLAIFHPRFIEACLSTGDCKKVAVGDYFLPPAELHEMISDQMDFGWETDPLPTPQEKPPTPSRAKAGRDVAPPVDKVEETLTSEGSVLRSPRAPVKAVPKSPRSSVKANQRQAENTATDKRTSKRAGCGSARDIDDFPDYISVDSLQLDDVPLEDFIIGRNGCQVSHWT